MCCRYHLSEKQYRELMSQLGIARPAAYESRYNIAPSTAIPVVRASEATNSDAGREAVGLRWGLTPAWAATEEPAARLINARAETLTEKPSFRDALARRRCVIPASGFYEWEKVGGAKRPWMFRLREEAPFGFAGLWDSWRARDGTVVESCTVITTGPNELMRPIHHRMPAILLLHQFDSWLDPASSEEARLSSLLRPLAAGEMVAVRVNPGVNNVHFEGPQCIEPSPAGVGVDDEPQLSLGL
jgi:putative SOS response-associated peptidase YedK